MQPTYVVIGASLAGGTAAATLRTEGFPGRVVLVGEEPLEPYERPPLSKEFLAGSRSVDQLAVRPAGFWEEQDVETLFGVRALHIDPTTRSVVLDNGDTLTYDKALVATGLRNRVLRVPGADLAGVHSLRTVADAEAIRRAMQAGGRAVVIGMGFIGAEVTATLRGAGVEVEVVEPLPGPVYRALGPLIGPVLGAVHEDRGARLHFAEGVAALEGSTRVELVVTTTGRRLGCDFVVVGVGTQVATDVLDGTGVALDNGVVVDARCRSSVEGIYAAGDIANHYHPTLGRHVRVEHWQNALKQGAAAARSMLGDETPYDEVHWFWSDQYNVNIQCAGLPANWEDVVVRGSLDSGPFVAYTMQAQRIEGAVAFNNGRDLRRSLALLKSGVAVDRERLADPAIDVREAALA